MNYKILKANNFDLINLVALNQKYLPMVSSLDIQSTLNFLKISNYFKIIKFKNELIGFLIALEPNKEYSSLNYKWFEKRYKSFLYIDRIVVKKEHQNKGLGTVLYQDLISYAGNKTNLITCEVNIKPQNNTSLLFHKKMGFSEVGTQMSENNQKEVSLLSLSIKSSK